MLPIVLASTSIYRKSLLEKLGLPFQAVRPDFIETSLAGESPDIKAQRLAEGKARSLAGEHCAHLIIGSDQVAFLPPGQTLSKPETFANAKAQLHACSGKTVHFYTGLCLLNSFTNTAHTLVEEYLVHFRTLTTQQINRYLELEQPYDCAGSFKSEGMGICLFERLEGNDPNTLIGLPLIRLTDLLAKEGILLPYSPPQP